MTRVRALRAAHLGCGSHGPAAHAPLARGPAIFKPGLARRQTAPPALAAVLLFCFGPSLRAVAVDTTADAVLGQTTFTGNAPNAPSGVPAATNLSLVYAAHLAIAPDGRLYVSDAANHRILSWPSHAGFANGAPADFVLGQPNFGSNAPNAGGVSASSLFLPQGLCVDAAGNLWVADAFNNRVLRFNNPLTDATPAAADLVIGQPDFTHNAENLGQGGSGPDVALPDSLQFPGRVLVRGPHVWVADSGNSRVLHYTAPTANKPFADQVLGQFGNFYKRAKNNDGSGQNGSIPSAANLLNPIGLALDRAGSLYVADWANHRVLRFDAPLADWTADTVIGQPNFTTGAINSGGPELGLNWPIDLAIDLNDVLLIADSSNNRVLGLRGPRQQPTADIVFGQLGSLSAVAINHGLGPGATDADALFGPTGVALDRTGRVLIVDTNNHRVMRYDAALSGRVVAMPAPDALETLSVVGYGLP